MRKPIIIGGAAAALIAGGLSVGLVEASGGQDPAVSLCGLGLNAQAGGDTPGGVSLTPIPFTPGFDSQAGSQRLNLFGPNDCATQQTVPTTTIPPTTTTTAPVTTTTTAPPMTTTTVPGGVINPEGGGGGTTVTTVPSTGVATASSASSPPVGAGGTSPSAVAGLEANALPNIAPADANGVTNGNG